MSDEDSSADSTTDIEYPTNEDGELDGDALLEEAPNDRPFVINTEEGDVEVSENLVRKLYKSYRDDKRWKKNNTVKSQQLAEERKAFEEEQKKKSRELDKKTVKKDEDYRAQGAMQNETENLAVQRAATYLGRDFEDFNYDTIKEFADEYSNDSMMDRLKFAYFAWVGSQRDNLIQEAKADVMRKAKGKKGLPSTAAKSNTPPDEASTLEELKELAAKSLKKHGGKDD